MGRWCVWPGCGAQWRVAVLSRASREPAWRPGIGRAVAGCGAAGGGDWAGPAWRAHPWSLRLRCAGSSPRAVPNLVGLVSHALPSLGLWVPRNKNGIDSVSWVLRFIHSIYWVLLMEMARTCPKELCFSEKIPHLPCQERGCS